MTEHTMFVDAGRIVTVDADDPETATQIVRERFEDDEWNVWDIEVED